MFPPAWPLPVRAAVEDSFGVGGWTAYTRPSWATMLSGVLIGGGAGGGGGFTGIAGAARGGGGGGACSPVTRFSIPWAFLPDTIYVFIGRGGPGVTAGTGTSGQFSYITTEPIISIASNVIVTTASSGVGGGGTGTGAAVGAAGLAGVAPSLANMPRMGGGQFASLIGGPAAAGGAVAGADGAAVAIPTTGGLTLGGSGGGGTTAGNFTGGAVTAIANSPISRWRPQVNAAGGNQGSNGTWLKPPDAPWFSFGGLGGGAANAAVGGGGGNGAPGSGGGGGGAGTTGGRGGDGGDGYCLLVSL